MCIYIGMYSMFKIFIYLNPRGTIRCIINDSLVFFLHENSIESFSLQRLVLIRICFIKYILFRYLIMLYIKSILYYNINQNTINRSQKLIYNSL